MDPTDEQPAKASAPIKRRVGGKNSDLRLKLTQARLLIDCNSLPNSNTRDSKFLIP
jgi:hypothetical protein